MGVVTTPDGRTIYVPDGMLGAPPVAPQIPGMPGVATPIDAAPSPTVPSTMNGLPSQVTDFLGLPSQQAAPPAPSLPVQSTPDYKTAPVDTKALTKQRAGAVKQQNAQRAYAATPEGQIAQGQQSQQQSIQRQEGIADAAGDVNAAEGAENQDTLDARNVALQQARGEQEQMEKERAKGLADKNAAYDKAVSTEANYKVDNNRRWANLSTGAKVAAGIGVALTAIGNTLQHKDGTNAAMSIITDAIKDDVAQQIQEREQLGKQVDRRRNSIDMYRQETGDIRSAANLKIAEEYKRAADQMEATAAKFTSPKAKLAAAQQAEQLRMMSGQLTSQTAEGVFNRDQQRQSMANARSQIGLGYANLKENKRQFDKGLELNNKKLLLDAAQLDQQGNAAAATAARAQATEDAKLGASAPPQVMRDSKGNVVVNDKGEPQVQYDMLKNQDGSVWHAPTDKEAQDLRASQDTAGQIVSIIDEIKDIRDKVGGESRVMNSTESQRLQVLKQTLVKIQKQGTQGMSSDADMARLEQVAGVENVDGWRDQSGFLDEARRQAIDNLNSQFRTKGRYTGPRIDFPNTMEMKPKDTPDDADAKTLMSKPSVSYDAAFDQQYKDAGLKARDARDRLERSPGSIGREKEYAEAKEAANKAFEKSKGAAAEYKDISPAQKQVIEHLTITASSAPDENQRRIARLTLGAAASGGPTEKIRAMAQAALVSLDAKAQDSFVPDQGVKSSATARDTVYGAP